MALEKTKLAIAKSKLPNPLGMQFGQSIDIDVTSMETGVSSPGDECMGIDTFKFVLTRNGWELFEPGKDNVAKLVESKPDESTCGENVVERLEEALALAKEGKIDNVMIIAIGNDGCNYDAWANGNRPFKMIGALESTKLDFFNTMTDRRG